MVAMGPCCNRRRHRSDCGAFQLHEAGVAYEVEFFDDAGETISVETVEAQDLRDRAELSPYLTVGQLRDLLDGSWSAAPSWEHLEVWLRDQ